MPEPKKTTIIQPTFAYDTSGRPQTRWLFRGVFYGVRYGAVSPAQAAERSFVHIFNPPRSRIISSIEFANITLGSGNVLLINRLDAAPAATTAQIPGWRTVVVTGERSGIGVTEVRIGHVAVAALEGTPLETYNNSPLANLSVSGPAVVTLTPGTGLLVAGGADNVEVRFVIGIAEASGFNADWPLGRLESEMIRRWMARGRFQADQGDE